MARSFKLPDLGEGIHEGEVLAVLVSVGDAVAEGDPILEVETDKAAVEIPSPFSGTVESILVSPGDAVHVGDVMMTFSGGDEAERPGPQKARKSSEEETSAPAETAAISAATPHPGPVPASPATRRLARELEVDLTRVPSSGPGGRVTAEDVRSFSEQAHLPRKSGPVKERGPERPSAAPPEPSDTRAAEVEQWGPIERQALRSIRRATARQTALAWSQIPHITVHDSADITKLDAFRQRHKAQIEAENGRLTLTVFILKAVVTALKKLPLFNASVDSGASEIILKKYYHIGVATDTRDGLIVPVLRDVDQKSIRDLAVELSELVQRTRDRKVGLEELQGASFTVTNTGREGGQHFVPIINYPQTAILGLGAARMQPVVRTTPAGENEIIARLMMPLILTMDHRVLDGADASKFLRLLMDSLEDPDQLLMAMI